LGQPIWKTVWRFLKKAELELSYNPVFLLLGIHAKKKNEMNTSNPMFIAALFTVKSPSRNGNSQQSIN
jgi:hypothetical protein